MNSQLRRDVARILGFCAGFGMAFGVVWALAHPLPDDEDLTT